MHATKYYDVAISNYESLEQRLNQGQEDRRRIVESFQRALRLKEQQTEAKREGTRL